jgi:hypothetical protein
VAWNGHQVLIDDKKFDMDGIRTFVHGLVEAVRERLHVELMFANDFLGRGNSSQAKETWENQTKVSPYEEGGYGDPPSAEALIDRSSLWGIGEATW